MACALGAVLAAPAGADKGDREKPINFSADQPAEVDFEKRVGTLRGNVVITQGTLTIRADRIDFKQNADNSLSATAFGNPVASARKRDDVDEYYEGFAQRAVYDGQKQLLELFDRALLKQGSDEIRSNYISYNCADRDLQGRGPPGLAPGAEGPGDRACAASFQPKSRLAVQPARRPRKATAPHPQGPAKDAKATSEPTAAPPQADAVGLAAARQAN